MFSGEININVNFIEAATAFVVGGGAGTTLSLSVGNILPTAARTVLGAGILQLTENKRNNTGAVVAPAATDDYSLGYRVGSLWFDAALSDLYFCINPAVGAAVWALA